MVIDNLRRNAEMAKAIIAKTIPQIPVTPDWPCHDALHNAIMTDKKLWPAKTKKELAPILAKVSLCARLMQVVHCDMFRRDLIPLLLDKKMSLSEIARAVHEEPKEVVDALTHLAKARSTATTKSSSTRRSAGNADLNSKRRNSRDPASARSARALGFTNH